MRTRRQTIEDLIEASDFKDSEIVLNIDFIRDLINDAVGQLKDATKIIADNKRHRTHIKQLKTANAELLTNVKQLESKCRQLERERDTLLEDVHGRCKACKHRYVSLYEEPCSICIPKDSRQEIGKMFEWRGAKEADHADAT